MNMFRQSTVGSSARALCRAAEEGNIENIKTLLKKDGNVNEMFNGFTPFHVACKFGKEEVVRFLLQEPNIDIDILDENESRAKKIKERKGTALHLACENDHKSVVTILLSHSKTNVNSRDNFGATPLHWSCREGHAEIVSLLLEQGGIDVNTTCSEDSTPLHYACFHNNEECARLLLAHPEIDLRKVDEEGNTVLHDACIQGNKGCVKVLSEHPQFLDIINIENREQKTPCEEGK